MSPPIAYLPEETARAMLARRKLLDEGASPADLVLTPSDLKRFGLSPWSGTFLGMRCAPRSIIEVVER